jgi:hypothetical protein
MRHYCTVFEVDDHKNTITEKDIGTRIEKYSKSLSGAMDVVSEKLLAKNTLTGFIRIKIQAWIDFDDKDSIDEDALDISDLEDVYFYVPYNILFHGSLFLKIRLMKFSPNTTHPMPDGTYIYIYDNPFDSYNITNDLLKHFSADILLSPYSRMNFTSSLKKLVKSKNINSTNVKCDDDNNYGFHHRSMHKTNKTLVEWDWFGKHHFFTTDKIYDTVWAHTKGKNLISKINSYDRLGVESQFGVISKISATEDNLIWFVDEIIREN